MPAEPGFAEHPGHRDQGPVRRPGCADALCVVECPRAAFAAEGALDKTVRLPFGEFPGAVLRDLAAIEQFTHGWDLARAIGYSADLDPELAAGLLSRARLTITDAYRGPDGEAFFGPAQAPAG